MEKMAQKGTDTRIVDLIGSKISDQKGEKKKKKKKEGKKKKEKKKKRCIFMPTKINEILCDVFFPLSL